MNYGFDLNMKDPQLVQWAQQVNARNDAKAKESRDNMMNLLKVAGIATAAYKGDNSNIGPEDQKQFNSQLYTDWDNYSPEDKLALFNAGYIPLGKSL